MSPNNFFSVFFLAVILVISHAEEKEMTTCDQKCEGTYPPHTFEPNDASVMCTRGCKFASLGEVTNSLDPESIAKDCKADCEYSYSKNPEYCSAGCEFQVQTTKDSPKDMEMVEMPVFDMTQMYAGMVQRMMQHYQFAMSMLQHLDDEDMLSDNGGINFVRIQTFTDEDGDGQGVLKTYVRIPVGEPENSLQEEPEVEVLPRRLHSRCPLSGRWRRFVLLLLFVAAAVLLCSLLYSHMINTRKHILSQRTKMPVVGDDDARLLIVSNSDTFKLPLDDDGKLEVHQEPPLPIKAKI